MNANQLLIELLTATDATIAPLRAASWAADGWSAFYADIRKNYRTTGLPWDGPGDSTARSRQQRLVETMVSDGLLFRGPSTATRLAIGLTCKGESRARALCGWQRSHFQRSIWILETLSDGRERPETDFLDIEWGDDGAEDLISDLQCDLLPLYFRRLVSTSSTVRGHVFLYSEAGTSARLEDLYDAKTKPLPDGDERYGNAIMRHRKRLRRYAAGEIRYRQELGPIPRSASR